MDFVEKTEKRFEDHMCFFEFQILFEELHISLWVIKQIPFDREY
jgi:hypothetical protein